MSHGSEEELREQMHEILMRVYDGAPDAEPMMTQVYEAMIVAYQDGIETGLELAKLRDAGVCRTVASHLTDEDAKFGAELSARAILGTIQQVWEITAESSKVKH